MRHKPMLDRDGRPFARVLGLVHLEALCGEPTDAPGLDTG